MEVYDASRSLVGRFHYERAADGALVLQPLNDYGFDTANVRFDRVNDVARAFWLVNDVLSSNAQYTPSSVPGELARLESRTGEPEYIASYIEDGNGAQLRLSLWFACTVSLVDDPLSVLDDASLRSSGTCQLSDLGSPGARRYTLDYDWFTDARDATIVPYDNGSGVTIRVGGYTGHSICFIGRSAPFFGG